MLIKSCASAVAIIVAIPLAAPHWRAQAQQAPGTKAEGKAITCRIMESFDDQGLGVRAIIFHQRDKADGPRLGSALLAHSGKEMEIETAKGQHFRVTVFRVRSAFGRGLILFPLGRINLREQDEFALHIPPRD